MLFGSSLENTPGLCFGCLPVRNPTHGPDLPHLSVSCMTTYLHYCDVRLSLGLGYWSSYSQGQLFEGKISELWGNIKARKGWRKVRNILWISEMMRLYCPVFLSSRPHFTSANWLVVLQCSVTCGIGSRRRAVICSGGRNKCDPKSRPEDISQCNPGACPEWKAGEWSKVGVFQIFWFFFLSHSRHFYSWSKNALIVFMIIYSKCSVTCGSGSKQRRVECSRSDVTCDLAKKPTSAARCELGACPKWETGEWSLVSVFQTTLNYHWAAVVILGSYVIVPRLGLTVVQPHRNRTLVLLPNATAIWMLVTGRNHVPSF